MLENIMKRFRNLLEFRLWYTLSYHKMKLKLAKNPRKGVCECCQKKCWTNIHHWLYRYTYTDVRKNNRLALNYTTEVCYPDHELGEALRRLFNVDAKMKIRTSNVLVKRLIELRAEAIARGETGWKKRV